jgi:hypothetical protein
MVRDAIRAPIRAAWVSIATAAPDGLATSIFAIWPKQLSSPTELCARAAQSGVWLSGPAPTCELRDQKARRSEPRERYRREDRRQDDSYLGDCAAFLGSLGLQTRYLKNVSEADSAFHPCDIRSVHLRRRDRQADRQSKIDIDAQRQFSRRRASSSPRHRRSLQLLDRALKVLDLERPIREADSSRTSLHV